MHVLYTVPGTCIGAFVLCRRASRLGPAGRCDEAERGEELLCPCSPGTDLERRAAQPKPVAALGIDVELGRRRPGVLQGKIPARENEC